MRCLPLITAGKNQFCQLHILLNCDLYQNETDEVLPITKGPLKKYFGHVSKKKQPLIQITNLD